MKKLLKKLKTLAVAGIAMGLAITPVFAGSIPTEIKDALGGGAVANPTGGGGEIVIHEDGTVTYNSGSASTYSGGSYYAITKAGEFGEEVSGIRTEGNVANTGSSITFTGVRGIDNGSSTLKISSMPDGIAVTNAGWIGAINQQSSSAADGTSDLDVQGVGDIIVKSTASGKGAKGIGAYSAQNPDITQNKINVQAKSLTVEAEGGTAYGIQGCLAGRTTTINIENALTVKGIGSDGKAYLSNLTQASPLGKATLNFGSVSAISEKSLAYGFHSAGDVDADITLNGDMTVVGSTYGMGFRVSGATEFDLKGKDGKKIDITASSTSNYSMGADVGNSSTSTAKLNLDVDNFTVASENAEAYGLYAEASPGAAIVADVNNLSVSAGTDAYAIYTEGGAVTILNSATITAQGKTSSKAVYAAAGATVTFSNSVTLVGDVTNAGTIAIGVYTGKPSINLTGAFANTGTLAVDMTGATEDSYKIVSATAASDYGTVTLVNGNYAAKITGNDLYAVKAVCQIFDTGVKYDSLTNALIAVQNGQTIQMLVASTAETLPACSVYGGPKTFTLQGLTDGDGYTEIAGAAGDATVENVTNTFRNINWTKPFSNRNLFKADFDFCKFTGEGGVVNARASGGATSLTQAVWIFQACKFEQTGATAVQFDEGKNVRVTFQNCDIRGKVCGLTAGYNNAVTFFQCTLDGSVEDSEGKYFAEVTCPATVTFSCCAFTDKFIAGVTAAKNAGNNGINIPDGYSYMFLNCSSGMAALVGEIGTGSTALISSDVEMAIFADGVTALNQVLTGYQFPTITGMDTLTGRVKYDFSTLTADGWSNGSTNYAATLSGTLTVSTGLTFSVAAEATVKENTVIRLAADHGGEAYNTWLASNLTAEQAANATVAGWVAAIGDTKYYTLADALTAVKADETVKLLCNLTETAAVTAPALAFSLDLAGFNYTNSAGFATQSGKTITLTDSTEPAAATKFCVTAITGAGSIVVDTKANVALDNVTSAASFTNNGKLAADVFALSNSLVSTGTLALKDSTVNVSDNAVLPTETMYGKDYKTGIKLSGNATLTNAICNVTFSDNVAWYRARGVLAGGVDTVVNFVTEAGKTTSISFDRSKARNRSQTGYAYGVTAGTYNDGNYDNAKITFGGAGDLAITGNSGVGLGGNYGNYGYTINGVYVYDENNSITFANEGKTTITSSGMYGVNGVCTYGAVNFTKGTVLIDSYIDGGVAFSNNIGLYNSGNEKSQFNVTDGVDELTIFTEGAAYDAEEGSGDVSNGAAAIYESSGGGSTVINAKKLNVLAVSGEDTDKEWTIGGTKVIGHTKYSAEKKEAVGATKYSTSYGIENDYTGSLTVGADTVTTIHTRDFEKNSIAVASTGVGSIDILGNTTIVAEGNVGTYALYVENSGSITIGSEGKTVDITGDILANGTYEDVPAVITLAGDANTVAGSLTVTNGAEATLYNTVLTGANGEVYTNSILNLSNTTLKVAAFVNTGSIAVNMAGFTVASFTIVEITGGGEKTLEDFGTVELTGSDAYELMVDGNCLMAVYTKYPVVATPAPAAEHSSLKVYTDGSEAEEIPGQAGSFYVWTNRTAYVVYTADYGYMFEGGLQVVTNAFDTTTDPAVQQGTGAPAIGTPKLQLGVVAQRYPWNGSLDVSYRVSYWPIAGTQGAVEIKLGETVTTNYFDFAGRWGNFTGSQNFDLQSTLPQAKGKLQIRALTLGQ